MAQQADGPWRQFVRQRFSRAQSSECRKSGGFHRRVPVTRVAIAGNPQAPGAKDRVLRARETARRVQDNEHRRKTAGVLVWRAGLEARRAFTRSTDIMRMRSLMRA